MNIPLRRYWELLAGYLKGQSRLFALLFVVLLSSIGFTVLLPQITRRFVDGAAEGVEPSTLVWLAAAYLVVAIGGQLLSIGTTWVGQIVAWNATNRLRVDLADHCLGLDMAFHKGKTPGEMIERLDEDVTAMAQFFSQLVVRVGGSLLLVAAILTMFSLESGWLALAFGAFAFASVFLLNRMREIAVPYEVKRREVIAELFGYLEERLSGTEDIRANGAVDYVINGLYRIQSDLLIHWRNAQMRYWILGTVSRSIVGFGYCLALISGYLLYDDGVITVGTAFLIVQYMNVLARPLTMLAMQIEQLQGVGASLERIAELLDARSTLKDGHLRFSDQAAKSLAFERVTFAYEPDNPVLKDVSFELGAGRVLGILGRTGSGKTTLARMIFRLYDADKGAIRVGGHDVREVQKESLTNAVAMVTQDVQLFQASVRDNLTFFDRGIADDTILAVLKQVELWDWYQRLPRGLETHLESGGSSMSAGEAQLLAFARVFLKNPTLVILDEASSRLDPATEARIERALDRLLADRTGVIIAHRLATLHRADDVLILEEGRIVEQGERLALLEDDESRFSRLMETGLEEELA